MGHFHAERLSTTSGYAGCGRRIATLQMSPASFCPLGIAPFTVLGKKLLRGFGRCQLFRVRNRSRASKTATRDARGSVVCIVGMTAPRIVGFSSKIQAVHFPCFIGLLCGTREEGKSRDWRFLHYHCRGPDQIPLCGKAGADSGRARAACGRENQDAHTFNGWTHFCCSQERDRKSKALGSRLTRSKETRSKIHSYNNWNGAPDPKLHHQQKANGEPYGAIEIICGGGFSKSCQATGSGDFLLVYASLRM